MTEEVRTHNILYMQIVQSKSLTVFLLIFTISGVSRTFLASSWIFDFILYGSVYFIIYLLFIALANALHEKGHIKKLQELGYHAMNFQAHRIGDVSFSIENIEKMSADEAYQVASAPFLLPTFYTIEFVSLLLLLGISILSPFPLDIILLATTGLISVSFLGSLCALIVIQKSLISGSCVWFARTVTSRGDIDDIVTWNTMHEKGK